MKESGIDLSTHFSKSFTDPNPTFTANLDFIITLCAEEVCPVITSKAKKLHWPFPDPGTAGSETKKLQMFRAVREAIREKIVLFKTELTL